MRTSDLFRGALALCFLTACGGSQPVAATGPSGPGSGAHDDGALRVASPDNGATVAPAEAIDLTPVPAPGPRVAYLRWNHPRNTLTALASFSTIPSNVVEAGIQAATREFAREQFDASVDTDALGDLIRLDAPMEMVVVVTRSSSGEPQPMAAISVGVSSLERARATSRVRSRKLSPGVWRLGEEHEFGDACVLAASGGATPARLVCADSQREALALARYMATTLPLEVPSTTSDLSLELSMRPVIDRHQVDIKKLADELRGEASNLAREFPSLSGRSQAIVDVLAQEMLDAAADADGFAFELDVDSATGLRARTQIRFAGRQSWTVNAMTDGAALADVAPDIFWSLPATSDGASYGHAADPSIYKNVLSVLRDGMSDMLKQQRFGTAADRAAMVKLLRLPVSKHVAAASGRGHFASTRAGGGNMAGLIDDSLGWYLYGVDEGSAQLKAYITELVRLYNRPTIQTKLKREAGRDARHMPRVKIVAAPASLGPQRLAVELVVPDLEQLTPGGGPSGNSGNAQAKVTEVKFHLLLGSNGRRTWLRLSTQRNELVQLMAGLRRGASAGLGTRTDLQVFRTDKHAAASFTDMAGMSNSMKPLAELGLSFGPGTNSPAGQRILAAFGNMPNQGKTPMLSFIDVTDGGRPTTHVSIHVPRESLQDLGFLISETIGALE